MPPLPSFDIRGSGTSFALVMNGQVVAYDGSYDRAAARTRRLQSRAQTTRRACLCCGAMFNSAHKGNRLCRPCKDTHT
jgi:hypothetical protein